MYLEHPYFLIGSLKSEASISQGRFRAGERGSPALPLGCDGSAECRSECKPWALIHCPAKLGLHWQPSCANPWFSTARSVLLHVCSIPWAQSLRVTRARASPGLESDKSAFCSRLLKCLWAHLQRALLVSCKVGQRGVNLTVQNHPGCGKTRAEWWWEMALLF